MANRVKTSRVLACSESNETVAVDADSMYPDSVSVIQDDECRVLVLSIDMARAVAKALVDCADEIEASKG